MATPNTDGTHANLYATPSVLTDSFEKKVMADLEDIKRSNKNIQAQQILLKSMIERMDSLFFKSDLKEIARHLKNHSRY
ncbi:hypothetical protein PIB30_087863 [Stylosanthes scabra]|uniref:Uncharacterized protein n=1 Tax=Stylosanthes scabra TaxID=79078 RepID=A0ABU6RTF5_9FABA|nr:hypothetical protein [Stylosanthes scabra]